MLTLDKIEAAHFDSHRGELFQADAAGYSGSWELIEVTLLGIPKPEAVPAAEQGTARRSFSLVFKAPVKDRLPQSIYSITHPDLGTLDIFLVPIRADENGYYLEAVFN